MSTVAVTEPRDLLRAVFADRLSRARSARCMSACAVAVHGPVLLDPQSLRTWEWGQKTPKLTMVLGVAFALHVPAWWLAGDGEDEVPQAVFVPAPDIETAAVRFGRRVQAERDLRGWKQKDLAERTNVTAASVRAVELAARGSVPLLSTVVRLAAALEVSNRVLLEYRGEGAVWAV